MVAAQQHSLSKPHEDHLLGKVAQIVLKFLVGASVSLPNDGRAVPGLAVVASTVIGLVFQSSGFVTVKVHKGLVVWWAHRKP